VRLNSGRYHSFVVRIWCGEEGHAALRGQITHFASNQIAGFTDLERIPAFIRTHMARPGGDGTSAPSGAGERGERDGGAAS
jgi:hypothetical protein